MKVTIDLTALLSEHTGVDHYLMHLVKHLGRLDEENHYTILVNLEDRALFNGLFPPNFGVVPLSFRPRPARLLFQQVILPVAAQISGADVIHSPSFIMPLYRGRQRHLLTVYDMTFFSLPEHHIPLRRSAPYRKAVLGSIRRASLVSVPSHATRQEILELIPTLPPARVRVIKPGISEEFRVYPPDEVRQRIESLGLPSRYILYVGTIEPRKNLQLLVASYRSLVAEGKLEEHLVLAGRLGWGYESLLAQLGAAELRERVHLTGYVPQANLPWLYAGARLFVYPSLQEGFGFPPLEAMASGLPTIVSRSSSLLENLEGAAELVPVEDVEALTAAMKRLLRDEQLRAERCEQGIKRAADFRWEETARQTLACYQELATSRFQPMC